MGPRRDRNMRREDTAQPTDCYVSSRFSSKLAPAACADVAALMLCAPLPAEHLLRDYCVEEALGEGRFGTVWKCTEWRTGAEAACKQVGRGRVGRSAAPSREAACLALVQGHENVLRLEGVYEGEEHLYLLTELCPDGDLLDVLTARGALPEAEARGMFQQLVKAVHHCHTRGVIHRDIKPENVLLRRDPVTGKPVLKLADFGLSKRLQDGERAHGWVGSEPYEAPEVIQLQTYDFSADVFSLGVVFFGMLSGTWPVFLEGRHFNAGANFNWPGWHCVSKDAKDLIARMLSPDPDMRPTAAGVLGYLSCFAADDAPSPCCFAKSKTVPPISFPALVPGSEETQEAQVQEPIMLSKSLSISELPTPSLICNEGGGSLLSWDDIPILQKPLDSCGNEKQPGSDLGLPCQVLVLQSQKPDHELWCLENFELQASSR